MTRSRFTNSWLAVGGAFACCGLLATTAAIAQTDPSGAPTIPSAATVRITDGFTAFAESEARFSSWRGTRGSNIFDPAPGKGSQFYSPFTVGFDQQVPDSYRAQVRAKSGYVHSSHRTPGQEASIDTMVDTQVTVTVTNLANESYRTFVGVALNLPTGETFLPNNKRLTRMDPDLVDVGSYGAGINVNPTVGLVFALTENTGVSVSAGYSWQGSFTREALNPASIPPCPVAVVICPAVTPRFDLSTTIDPGDVFTANLNTSSIYENLAIKNSVAFMSETTLKQDGIPVGRKGLRLAANSAFTYRFDPRWTIVLNGSWSFAGKDKVARSYITVPHDPVVPPVTPPVTTETIEPLLREPKNSNSHVVIGSVEPIYALTERMNVAANYSVLWRSKNSYDFIEDRFVPAKLKQSVGGSLTYLVTPMSSVSLRGSHFWVHIDAGQFQSFGSTSDPGPGFFPPSLHYTGWTAAMSGKIQF